MGAVEAPCWARLRLVCRALAPGSLGLAEGADDRTSAPWKAVVAARRPGLGPGVREGVRDRANAVIPLAAQGVGCLRRPDGLPGVPARRKRSALTLGRHRRPAQQARKPAQAALARWQEPPHAAPAAPGTPLVVVARHTAGRRWGRGAPRSRGLVATRSRTRQPCRRADAAPQTSAQGARHLQAPGAASAGWAPGQQGPVRHVARPPVRQPWPGLAAGVACWWAGGRRDGAPAALAPLWPRGAAEAGLPRVAGAHHVAHPRCPRRKATLRHALEAIHVAVAQQALPPCLPPPALQAGHAWAPPRVRALQRASSAVAGRHGALAHRPHQQRGVPQQRDKVGTGLPHVAGRAGEGTTPAGRCCRRSWPDLCATALSHIAALPQPRRRRRQGALSHCSQWGSRLKRVPCCDTCSTTVGCR